MRVLVVVAIVAFLSVQAKPDFSGTWTLVSSDSPAAAAGAKPVVVVLTHTDSTLTMKNGDQAMVFPLDGSEVKRQTQGSGAPQELKIRTRWEGARLVVEQVTANSVVSTIVSMSDDGSELTVETVAKTPQGEGREKQRFKRSK